jgi:hypothetical protein
MRGKTQTGEVFCEIVKKSDEKESKQRKRDGRRCPTIGGKPIQTRIDLKQVIYGSLKIARVLVRFDHAARFIGNAKLPSA